MSKHAHFAIWPPIERREPITYDQAGNVTPLRAVEHQLDVAA